MISANVRAEIARWDMRESDVRRAVGMSRSTWRRRMAGEVGWRIDELTKLSRTLRVPLERLTREDEDR